MKLYVANTSKQNHDFLFYLAEHRTAKRVYLLPGSQSCIGDFTPEENEKIIKHYAVYGMIRASEASRRRGFSGLVYELGKPVTFDQMQESFEDNDRALESKGDEQREKIAELVARNMRETLDGIGGHTMRAEVETVKDGNVGTGAPGTGMPVSESPELAVGYESVADGVAPRHGGKQGRRARAA